MPEIRRYICPNPECQKRIKLEYLPAYEEKNVAMTCIACKKSFRFREWKLFVEDTPKPTTQDNQGNRVHPEAPTPPKPQQKKQDEDATDIAHVVHTIKKPSADNDSTQLAVPPVRYIIGRLRIPGCAQPQQLSEGSNIVGRKALTSKATIQIDDSSRTISREHFYINVLMSAKGMFHSFYLTPGSKNPTFLNGVRVEQDDRYFLNNGDRIQIGNCTITFEVDK